MRVRLSIRVAGLVGLAAAVTLAGCSSSSSGPDKTSAANTQGPTAATPKAGGTLVFGEYSGINSLDPEQINGGVTSGGNEGAAIYGTLMRYDTGKKQYVPYLAKSLTSDSTHTKFTLALRPGMTFSDGSPYNAQAVVQNIERDKASFYTVATDLQLVSSVKAVDDTTVSFTLAQPWSGFAFLLSETAGMIGAPGYIAQLKANPQATPVGAGPFMVSDFKPGTSLTLKPNPKYAFDKPYLSTLKFMQAGNEESTLQAFSAGQLDAGIVIDGKSNLEVKEKKIPTIQSFHDAGAAIIMNTRKTSPLSNVKLRQAIAMAFNPNVWNERQNQGQQVVSDLLFPKGSVFYSEDEQKLPYNPDKAKQLVDQVKSETGWNGKLSYVGPSTQTNEPVVLQSLLTPIGVTLEVRNLPVSNFITEVYVKHQFDISGAGAEIVDYAPFISLWGNFVSPHNVLGYNDSQMTEIVREMGEASTLDEQRTVMKKFLALYLKTFPVISQGRGTWNVIHTPKVHGLDISAGMTVLFDKAWVS